MILAVPEENLREDSSGDPLEQLSETPFKLRRVPLCAEAIRNRFPEADEARIAKLGTIWDEVVHRIIQRMLTLSLPDAATLHINIREEMVQELAQLQFWLSDRVIERRVEGKSLDAVDEASEREACLGPEGTGAIEGTAQMAYEHVWTRRLDERWRPKSAKAIEREKSPRLTSLAVKPVGKNHFIPRWFIRDHWSVGGKVLRWRRTADGWTSSPRGFNSWGFRHNLYSDQLEAYFSLLEGDAKQPITMLLETRPLNAPQRDALVGFLAIQLLRNPFFIAGIGRTIAPMIAREGYADDPDMPRKAYESMYQNNELYDHFARPIMWSRWAIVKSELPLFVLPDTFSIRGDVGDGLRMIVPLTPRACFVTLSERESGKRIVPRHLAGNEPLARKISSALVAFAREEFISSPDFVPIDTAAPTLTDLLDDIALAIAAYDEDET